MSFIVTLSESSYLIVESDSFVTFDFFLSAAFDQKFVIVDFFVNDKIFLRLLASSILPQVHCLPPQFFPKFIGCRKICLHLFPKYSHGRLGSVFILL